MSFAQNTSVPVDRSRAEIEKLVRRYGAEQYVSGWDAKLAQIGFRCHDRYVRFRLPLPDPKDKRFARYGAYDQEMRRLWRCLCLVIKAKLEAVESGIATFENEFMAHIVMPDGRTVGEHVSPQIESAYKSGKAMPLLLGSGER